MTSNDAFVLSTKENCCPRIFEYSPRESIWTTALVARGGCSSGYRPCHRTANMHTCQDIFKRERLSRVAVSTTCWSSLQCTQRIAHTSQSAAPFVIKMSSPSISISISKLFRPDLSGPWSNFCPGCLLELLPASSQYLAKRMDFCFFHFVLFFESGN